MEKEGRRRKDLTIDNKLPKSLDEVLEMIGNKDPSLQLMARFIQETQSLQTNTDDSDITQLRREYSILVKRNNLLASALGACPYCWGTDVRCECRGQGRVGSMHVDRESFSEIILPVLNKLETVSEMPEYPYKRSAKENAQTTEPVKQQSQLDLQTNSGNAFESQKSYSSHDTL